MFRIPGVPAVLGLRAPAGAEVPATRWIDSPSRRQAARIGKPRARWRPQSDGRLTRPRAGTSIPGFRPGIRASRIDAELLI
jgi:hypothetical protein